MATTSDMRQPNKAPPHPASRAVEFRIGSSDTRGMSVASVLQTIDRLALCALFPAHGDDLPPEIVARVPAGRMFLAAR